MKKLTISIIVTVLTGCAGMGTSGGMSNPSTNENPPNDIFRSYQN